MPPERSTRRRFLASLAAAGTGLAGCATPESAFPAGARTPSDEPAGTAEADNRVARIYRGTIGSVAMLRVYTGAGGGQATGFVFDDGHMVTNQHVVASATGIEAKFNRGEWRSPSVVGTDAYSDLAVLAVDPPGYADPLDLAEEPAFVGQEVLAIGNPFGLASSLSTGIVSGVNRVLPAPNGFTIPDAVQTTAPLNPGNSGGPLVTMDGRVAGTVSSGGGDNVGFAISAPLMRRVVPALIDDGEYDHSFMGVRLLEVTPIIAEANTLAESRGVLVVDVKPGGPSDGVLRGSDSETVLRGTRVPVGGDVIVGMDGREIPSLSALSTFLALETRPDETVEVTVLRDGDRRTVDLTLGARPPP